MVIVPYGPLPKKDQQEEKEEEEEEGPEKQTLGQKVSIYGRDSYKYPLEPSVTNLTTHQRICKNAD